MNMPEAKTEQLEFQIDILVGLEPETVGRAVEKYDYSLPADLENWAHGF